MLIEISNRNVALEREQKDWIERRLMFALGRFVGRIQRVSVTLSDVNGSRGGNDKKCRVRVSLAPQGEVIVEDTNSSVEAAITSLVDRAARSVSRKLVKEFDQRLSYGTAFNSARPAAVRS